MGACEDTIPRPLGAFADFLLANQEEITRRWVTAVDRSPEITSSEDLTYRQLLDHFPQLCQELAALLRTPGTDSGSAATARAHGRKRWQQGYKLEELIREICLIRGNFMDVWPDAFAAINPSFDAAARQRARQIVSRFFDGVIIDSTSQFVEEQTDALRSMRAELDIEKRAAGEAKSRLLREVGHTLREPLAAIVLAAEALAGEKSISVEGQKMVRVVLRNAKLETAQVEELLIGAELFLEAGGAAARKVAPE